VQWIRIVSLSAGLAALPSIGTQGMGTLGDRFVHPDSLIYPVEQGGDLPHDAAIRGADRLVEAQVELLLARKPPRRSTHPAPE
jgi:hypothetical protein